MLVVTAWGDSNRENAEVARVDEREAGEARRVVEDVFDTRVMFCTAGLGAVILLRSRRR